MKQGFVFLPLLIVIALGIIVASGYYYRIQGKLPLNPGQNASSSAELKIPSKNSTESSKNSTISKSPALKPKPKVVSLTPSPTSSPSINNDPITDQADCGGNLPPGSDFTPPSGKPPLVVGFSPSGGVNYKYGTMVGYQWDYEGDGVWDTGVIDPSYPQTYQHTYTKAGTYTPVYRVRTSEHTWSKNCSYPYKVIVTESGAAVDNGAIIVDRSTVELTVKKSDYPGKSYIDLDGFRVSAKDKFVFVTANFSNPFAKIFVSSQGANIMAGKSYLFHITVDLNAAPGEYTDQIDITYKTFNDDNSFKEDVKGPALNAKVIIED